MGGVAPRSCSMGDLTGGASPRKSHGDGFNGPGYDQQTVPVTNAPPGIHSSLVTSLPLPPATSVTYEFSLAPVSGTLAPGWHLTAVQRGLATAVPLAAVVARRRLPRPRPPRQRFGFTDKNEARRAKWTIAVTALGLLAMSMLLVGITLRLAPLIDDLVRKENEDLLRGIVQTASSLNVTSTTSMSASAAAAADNIVSESSPSNQTENVNSSNGGAVMSNLQQPRQRRLTTAWTRLILSSPSPSSSTSGSMSSSNGNNGRSKSTKIASLTRTHSRNQSKSPSSSPAPPPPVVATVQNVLLQQLMMSHASYYETPRGQHYEEVGQDKQFTTRQELQEMSIEDHDEAPVVMQIRNTA